MAYGTWAGLASNEHPTWAEIEDGVATGVLQWQNAEVDDPPPHGQAPETFPHAADVDLYVKGTGVLTPASGDWAIKSEIESWKLLSYPTAPKPTLVQTQLSGGDVEANWVNAVGSGGLGIRIEWEINSASHDVRNLPAGTIEDTLDELELANFDNVRARLQYFLGAGSGAWGAWSDALQYVD